MIPMTPEQLSKINVNKAVKYPDPKVNLLLAWMQLWAAWFRIFLPEKAKKHKDIPEGYYDVRQGEE